MLTDIAMTAEWIAPSPTLRSNLVGVLKTMRPRQWTKNSFVFAALVFDGKLFQLEPLTRTALVCLIFCLAASSVYLFNDLMDMEKDREHPRKRMRPLPRGDLSPWVAVVSGALLALSGLGTAFLLDRWVGVIVAVYLVQNLFYNLWLKNIVIIDAFSVSLGFLLRVIAGAAVVQVQNFSPWLYVCSALLTLFISFGKRRHELTLLAEEAHNHRATLHEYNLPLLDQIMTMITTSMLMAYTLYTFEATTALASSQKMLLTVPFVFYFVARYLYLIHVRGQGGAPEELLFQDRPMLTVVLLWGLSVVAVIYWV